MAKILTNRVALTAILTAIAVLLTALGVPAHFTETAIGEIVSGLLAITTAIFAGRGASRPADAE